MRTAIALLLLVACLASSDAEKHLHRHLEKARASTDVTSSQTAAATPTASPAGPSLNLAPLKDVADSKLVRFLRQEPTATPTTPPPRTEGPLGLFRRAVVSVYFDSVSAGGACAAATNVPSPLVETLPKGNASLTILRCMNIIGISNPSVTVSVPTGGHMMDAHWHQISPPFGWANPVFQAAIDNFSLTFTATSAVLTFLNNGRGSSFVGSLIVLYLDAE